MAKIVCAPTSPSDKIPILVMNICISFSIFIASLLTSNTGNAAAAPPVIRGKIKINRKPAAPAKRPPSLQPPVSKIIVIAVRKPANAEPPQ